MTETFPKIKPTVHYQTLKNIKGPLVFLENINAPMADEILTFELADGTVRTAKVLETVGSIAVAQLFSSTSGLDTLFTTASFSGEVFRFPVSEDALGRTFSGAGVPLDGRPYLPEKSLDVNGLSINPVSREYPRQLVETGFSAIDLMLSIAQGQKIPIFSGAGLPHNQLAADIAKNSKVYTAGTNQPVGDAVTIIAGMGLTSETASFFLESFVASSDKLVFFLNRADDPTVERLLTPRLALTLGEFLAFEKHRNVLIILTDMTSYADALREVAAARDDVPGKRGYPAYMYTDLAALYERAGRLKGVAGSLTQLPILTMRNDDLSHPVPDLTGFITEGQIFLSRTLHNRQLYPPVDVLPSLSRLMKCAETREDHGDVAAQLYSLYAEGRDAQAMRAVVGELSHEEKLASEFVEAFEQKILQQETPRSIYQSLATAWELLKIFPPEKLKKITQRMKDKYYK